jgi:hypothetical protein
MIPVNGSANYEAIIPVSFQVQLPRSYELSASLGCRATPYLRKLVYATYAAYLKKKSKVIDAFPYMGESKAMKSQKRSCSTGLVTCRIKIQNNVLVRALHFKSFACRNTNLFLRRYLIGTARSDEMGD